MTTYGKLNKAATSGLYNWKTNSFIKSGAIIRFKDYSHIIRYNAQMTPREALAFNENANVLCKQFFEIIVEAFGKEIIIAPYDDIPWQKGYYYDTLKIKKGEMIITDEYDLLQELYYQAITYQAFPLFIDTKGTIAMSPTDHLDIFIAYNEACDLQSINIEERLEVVEWMK